jgi:hypothetical protein
MPRNIVYGPALKSMFSNRKVRSNKGQPHKKTVKPSNVIVVNAGGIAHVHAAPRARVVKRRAGYMTNNLPNNMGLSKLFFERKTRSNKGTKRGPRTKAGVNRMLAAKYF